VHRDDAVVDLAGVAAPLALDAGGFLTGLGMSGIVDDADGLGIGMIAPDDVLDAIAGVAIVPRGPIEELLECAAWRAVIVRDGLNALARQIGKLAFDITGEMATRLGASKAAIKLAKVGGPVVAPTKGFEQVSSVTPCKRPCMWELELNKNRR